MYKILEKKFDEFLDILTRSQRGNSTGYLTASGAVLGALLVRLAIAPPELGLPFLTFFPAVTLAALLGGFGPGLFALMVSSIVVSYLFIPPFNAFPLTFHRDVVWSNLVFNAEELGVIIVVEAMFRQRGNYVAIAHLLKQLELAQHELQIAAVAFESREGMMVTDATGIILRVNRAFTEISGYTAEEAVGQSPRLLQSGRHNADFYSAMWESIMRTGAWQGEIWDRHKNGQIYSTWHAISAVKRGDGVVTNYIGVHYDITERKNAEITMVKLNRDLRESRQRLRDLAAQNEARRESERKHIAQEVHDELGQVLTALRMDISLLGMRFGSVDPAVIDKVLEMKGLVDRAIQGVRNVAVNLRPTALDMGLVPAIEWLCGEFTERTAIACILHAEEENIDLDEARAVVIFRIVQESLTNVIRYANATQVDITISLRGDELWVGVRDNGRGFDLDAVTKRKSFGLLGMRERALVLGGQVDITSAPGKGTVIGVTIPINVDTAERDYS
jgi:PAS domain S-box-containing protein